MTELDPAYAERLRRACEDALVRTYGRAGYERLLAESRRRNASAPASNRSRVVDAGAWEPTELGGNPYGPDLRDAAR